MTFDEIQKICEDKLGATKLADIAHEFSVTPQVVSNWKARNIVPYKYVKVLRKKIKKIEEQENNQGSKIIPPIQIVGSTINEEEKNEVLIHIKGIIFTFIKKHKTIMTFSLFVSLAIILYMYFTFIPLFRSTTTILPTENESGSDKIAALTSQFGINTSSGGALSFDSKLILPELIESKSLSRKLLIRKFDSEIYGPNKTLYSILTKGLVLKDTLRSNTKFNRTVNKLRAMIKVTRSNYRSSPILGLSVTTLEPKLSQEIIKSVISELKIMQRQFNLNRLNQKKAFIERRFEEVSKTLEEKENNLTKFRKLNRKISSSPSLILEETRLLREVSVQSEIFLTLKAQYELAKIEEVEKSGSISIIDRPDINEIPINKPRYSLIFFGLFLIVFPISISIFIFYYEIYMNHYHKKLIHYLK